MEEKLRENLNKIFDEIKVSKETVSKTKNSMKLSADKMSINKDINKKTSVYEVEDHKIKLTNLLGTVAACCILFIGAGAIILLKGRNHNTDTLQPNIIGDIQTIKKPDKDKTDIKNIDTVIKNNINSIFEGKTGNRYIRMSLYRDGKNLTASYITQNEEDEEINLHGIIQINTASFNLYSDNNDIIFKGNIMPYTKEEDGYIEGTYTSDKNATDVHFSLSRSYSIDSSFDKRYSWCCENATTTEVEEFAKKIKKYIMEDNINNFVSLIQFPISVNIKESRVKINNAEEFKKKYNDIINTDFKDRISKVYTKYLNCKYEGIMLGLGEIWFTEGKEKLEIVAINN